MNNPEKRSIKIDPHVHLRDGNRQKHKETMLRGFLAASLSGLGAVFEMPNTDPPLTRTNEVKARIEKADRLICEYRIPLIHGLYVGLTDDDDQIREAVTLYIDLFPRVVGLKLYASHSTGAMGLVTPGGQKKVYQLLAAAEYKGVLAVHCEKEALLHTKLWDPLNPSTHDDARPPQAEYESVKDQLAFAVEAGFQGTLHICHISNPESVALIEETKKQKKLRPNMKITCGVTPHHLLFSKEMMGCKEGLFLKVNPPIRAEALRLRLVDYLKNGAIDWIETDHAPHTRTEKMEKYYSGIPGLHYYGTFIERLQQELGLTLEQINNITGLHIMQAFGLDHDYLLKDDLQQNSTPKGSLTDRLTDDTNHFGQNKLEERKGHQPYQADPYDFFTTSF